MAHAWRFGNIPVGTKINHWTFLEEPTAWAQRVRCQCDCGRIIETKAGRVLTEGSKQCRSCSNKETRSRPAVARLYQKDITGQQFGKLTAIASMPRRTGNRIVYWLCRCECGVEFEVNGQNLRNGKSTRCKSCAQRGVVLTHGDYAFGSKHFRLVRIWKGMIQRCHTPGRPDSKRYYDRGIAVCQEWRDDYTAFREWALASGYQDNLTLDRWPNQSGDYEPGNCRWATWKQQNRNRRNNRLLTAFGETKTVAEWADDSRCSVSREAILARLRYGWSGEEAILSTRAPGLPLSSRGAA